MKRANVCRDDVSSTSSSSISASPTHFTAKQSPHPVLPAVPQHHQQYMSLSPDHGLTPSSQVVTPPLQPAVAATTAASPTPASRTTSPELFVIPAEPRRRAGSRSKGNETYFWCGGPRDGFTVELVEDLRTKYFYFLWPRAVAVVLYTGRQSPGGLLIMCR